MKSMVLSFRLCYHKEVSRHPSIVKAKEHRSSGFVDIHIHGAFQIDVMNASIQELDTLSEKLWKNGISAFCPTTLSAPRADLARAVQQLGLWISQKTFPGARPIGIHLEGPFIHPRACGAHPVPTIRKLDWNELDQLWSLSQGHLKILTLAPELLENKTLTQLIRWSRKRSVTLSLGHSLATQSQAEMAFRAGFRGVTHLWNAMPFHHRKPGIAGCAIGRKKTYLELILDQEHVSPEVIQWTLQLHGKQPVCFISDCLAQGGFPQAKAIRDPQGNLCGGGKLLSHSYLHWLKAESRRRGVSAFSLWKTTLHHATQTPLKMLKLNQKTRLELLRQHRLHWEFSPQGAVRFQTHFIG